MYFIYKNGPGNIKSYMCDKEEDLENLPYNEQGSLAYIIETSQLFIVDSTGEWVDQKLNSTYVAPYTGETNYTIEDNSLTIATSGKQLNSNITVDISDLETLAGQIGEVVG